MKSLESKPEKSLLRLEKTAPEVYEALHKLKRTGWVQRGVENPESVKEHTEALENLLMNLQNYWTKKRQMA